MEDNLRLEKNSRNQQSLGTCDKSGKAQARQSLNLHDRSKTVKPNLSYADLHPEIKKTVKEISPKPSWNHQKQHRKAIEEEELVKYMSNLPSYLERGKNCQDKLLNVGVLDWGRLEKWQFSQKQIPHRSSRHSPSSSSSSPSFSTEGSSVHSSRGQSSSPGHQRMHRPSLQFHLMSSPMQGHSQVVKSSEENIGKFRNVKGSQANPVIEQDKFIRTGQSFSKTHPEINLDHCKRKDSHPKINPESATLTNGLNYEKLQCMKPKTKTQDGEFVKRSEKLREQKAFVVEQDCSQKCEAVVLIPRDLPNDNHSEVPQLSRSPTILGQRAEVASRRSFSDMPMDFFLPAVSSDVPHSCPLPYEMHRKSEGKWCSVGAESSYFFPDSLYSVPYSAKMGISPSRDRISEVKKSTLTTRNSTSKEPSMGLDLKLRKVATEKVRSTSPFRRLSIGVGKISKSFSSKEGSSIPQLSSTNNSAKSGSENTMASSCHDTSSSDAQNATSRARSSPLRRLLDPLLKPKAPNCRHSGEPLQRDSVSSKGQLDYLTGTAQREVVKLGTTSCSTINGMDSSKDKKHRSSTFQALLRVQMKNGQPLFTFAVDNERDILAATMKKLSTTSEDDYGCIYTFFSVQEVKRKNGRWINQGGKGKGHDYIPNVVAQLKVSGSEFSNLTGHNYIEQSFAREYVLFAVDLRRGEQQTLEFLPNDELAAIVVKIPKLINRSAIGDGHWTEKCNDLPEVRFNSMSVDVQNQPVIGCQSLISTTVILPSGIHSLPSKGGPSSLIQRWRSGGSCDCGGWDLGCKLRIFANHNQLSKKSSSTEPCPIIDKFELICQGGEEQHRPVFSLAAFSDGIYSVEFNSSLSILQAFSLCIAVLDGKKLCEISKSSNLFEEKTSLETVLATNGSIRAPNGIDGEVPARYVSYPPLSPVGRV